MAVVRSFRLPPGSRLEYTVGKGQEIQRLVASQPEVAFTSLNIGGGMGGMWG